MSLRQLAIRDGLTGLYNARFFSDALSKEHEYGFRKGSSLALVFMGIHHFKEVNDWFGYAFGDFILKSLAELLTTTIRGYDLLARYGGEEFVSLIREESELAVGELAYRICNEIRDRVFDHRLPSALAITGGMGLIEIQRQRIYCGWPMIISM